MRASVVPTCRQRANPLAPLLMAALAIVLLGLASASVRYWQYARQYESTDDAFIQGRIMQISPQVSA